MTSIETSSVSVHKRRWAVFTACFLIVLIAYCIRYGYGILLPEMLPSLNITKTEAGVIYSCFFIAYTIGSPLLGLMADRLNVRRLLTLFMLILGAGTFLMAYASSVVVASLYFTIVGIGAAATWVPVMALAQKWTTDKYRGTTLALIDIGSALGLILVSTLLPQIIAVQSWNRAWMVMGGMAMILGILTYILVRDPPRQTQSPSQTSRTGPGPIFTIYRRLLRDGRLWLIGLAYLLTGFAVMVPLTFLVTYANQDLAFSYEAATRLVVITGASAIAGKIILGYVSDKVRRKYILVLCGLLITAGCAGMAWLSGPAFYLAVAFFGAGYGAVWALYAACASDYFERELSGIIVGLWTVFLGVGLTLSPIIAGWLADITGALTWSFIAAGIGGLVSVIFLIPLGKPGPSNS